MQPSDIYGKNNNGGIASVTKKLTIIIVNSSVILKGLHIIFNEGERYYGQNNRTGKRILWQTITE